MSPPSFLKSLTTSRFPRSAEGRPNCHRQPQEPFGEADEAGATKISFGPVGSKPRRSYGRHSGGGTTSNFAQLSSTSCAAHPTTLESGIRRRKSYRIAQCGGLNGRRVEVGLCGQLHSTGLAPRAIARKAGNDQRCEHNKGSARSIPKRHPVLLYLVRPHLPHQILHRSLPDVPCRIRKKKQNPHKGQQQVRQYLTPQCPCGL